MNEHQVARHTHNIMSFFFAASEPAQPEQQQQEPAANDDDALLLTIEGCGSVSVSRERLKQVLPELKYHFVVPNCDEDEDAGVVEDAHGVEDEVDVTNPDEARVNRVLAAREAVVSMDSLVQVLKDDTGDDYEPSEHFTGEAFLHAVEAVLKPSFEEQAEFFDHAKYWEASDDLQGALELAGACANTGALLTHNCPVAMRVAICKSMFDKTEAGFKQKLRDDLRSSRFADEMFIAAKSGAESHSFLVSLGSRPCWDALHGHPKLEHLRCWRQPLGCIETAIQILREELEAMGFKTIDMRLCAVDSRNPAFKSCPLVMTSDVETTTLLAFAMDGHKVDRFGLLVKVFWSDDDETARCSWE